MVMVMVMMIIFAGSKTCLECSDVFLAPSVAIAILRVSTLKGANHRIKRQRNYRKRGYDAYRQNRLCPDYSVITL